MIRKEFDPAKLTDPDQIDWWNKWQARATKAIEDAIDEWETWLTGPQTQAFKYDFDNTIWGSLKDWLLENVFNFKCAYCETFMTRSYADAEHFRPKARVQAKPNPPTLAECTLDVPPGTMKTVKHPGYFWLAYCWENLVPSCEMCNRGEGKRDQFPATMHFVTRKMNAAELAQLKQKPFPSKKWPGWYYLRPADLDSLEAPEIINPMNCGDEFDPRKHIRFGLAGTVLTGTAIGEQSIRVYNLKQERLRIARQKAQERVRYMYFTRIATGDVQAANDALQPFRSGVEEYSAAALDGLDEIRNMMAGR